MLTQEEKFYLAVLFDCADDILHNDLEDDPNAFVYVESGNENGDLIRVPALDFIQRSRSILQRLGCEV